VEIWDSTLCASLRYIWDSHFETLINDDEQRIRFLQSHIKASNRNVFPRGKVLEYCFQSTNQRKNKRIAKLLFELDIYPLLRNKEGITTIGVSGNELAKMVELGLISDSEKKQRILSKQTIIPTQPDLYFSILQDASAGEHSAYKLSRRYNVSPDAVRGWISNIAGLHDEVRVPTSVQRYLALCTFLDVPDVFSIQEAVCRNEKLFYPLLEGGGYLDQTTQKEVAQVLGVEISDLPMMSSEVKEITQMDNQRAYRRVLSKEIIPLHVGFEPKYIDYKGERLEISKQAQNSYMQSYGIEDFDDDCVEHICKELKMEPSKRDLYFRLRESLITLIRLKSETTGASEWDMRCNTTGIRAKTEEQRYAFIAGRAMPT
jgi:hypothetical protein